GGLARQGSSLQGYHSQPGLQGAPIEWVWVGSYRSRRVLDYARGVLSPLRPGIQEDEGWRVGPVEEPRPQADTREAITLGSHLWARDGHVMALLTFRFTRLVKSFLCYRCTVLACFLIREIP